jgi:hypothetical protein
MTSLRSQTARLLAALALIAAPLIFSAQPAAAKNCDRACLSGLLTQYLQAMVAHKPNALPVTANVRFTENGNVTKIGEGFWMAASGLGSYRQDILDVKGHTAATQAVVLGEENGKPNQPVLFALRLKERGGKISEVETMVVPQNKDALIFNPAGYQQGNEQMAYVPPASEIDSRAESIKIAMKYPQGLKAGSFVTAATPFAPDGYRIENGIHTAGPGCKLKGCENITTQNIIKHPDVRVRFAAYDRHFGIVLLYLDFGQTSRYGKGRKLVTFEAFKIYGGQIHAVNAVLRITSLDAPSGWGPEHPVESPVASAK